MFVFVCLQRASTCRVAVSHSVVIDVARIYGMAHTLGPEDCASVCNKNTHLDFRKNRVKNAVMFK